MKVFSMNWCAIMLAAVLFLLGMDASGQGLTGQISGTVQDPAGVAVPNLNIELKNMGTGQVRSVATDVSGTFVVAELIPGTYMISINGAGFKTYEQTGIILTAAQRLSLRPITLELGTVKEVVSVSAVTGQLQLEAASGERTGLVTSSQMLAVPTKGRNYLTLLALMPGITQPNNPDSITQGLSGMHANGIQGGGETLNLDGIPNMDTGAQDGTQTTPSLESIAEVKVLTSNYQAEYGRSWGWVINVISKSGTSEFHGGAYLFLRNDALNANNFFNNTRGLKRPRYRYNFPGYTLGGPVLIPKVLRSRDRLFFFWSQEFLPQTLPIAQRLATFPTTLERAGNFSQTVDTNGALIPVYDPLSSPRKPFSGNVIPLDRIDKVGQALLSQFPLPNAASPTNYIYNSVYQGTLKQPHRSELLRVDWNIGSKTTFYTRLHHSIDNTVSNGWFSAFPVNNTYPQLTGSYEAPAKGGVATLIHTFSPTLVNELTFGVNRMTQTLHIDPASATANSRAALGVNFPQFYPQNNPFNVLPNASFGGVSSAPSISWESRFPFGGTDDIWNVSDNLAKTYGPHNLKAGIYIERTTRNSVAYSNNQSYPGTVSFGRDSNDPLDTNYAFANAMLGTITNYVESTSRPISHARYANFEWFVQDNWRVNKRLTLDLGVRFYRILPTSAARGQLGGFSPSSFDPAQAPQLVHPYLTSTGSRVGINPNTSELLPAVSIGTLAPGSGKFWDGMQTFSESIFKSPGLQAMPRFGFGWDVFGNQKLVVRGGFGMFPGRIGDDRTSDFLFQPPVYTMLNFNYTTISGLTNAKPALAPMNVMGTQLDFQPTTVYSYSFGVQRDLGLGIVVDAAYVATLTRHMFTQNSLNAVPYGTYFKASSIDKTLSGNTPLPLNFLRPLRGFGDVVYETFSGNSNFNSLQAQVNRRFTHNLAFGTSWTWSKAMGLIYSGALNPFINPRIRNYGKWGFDHTHMLVANFNYTLPKFSQRWDNILSRVVMDNWEVSGIVSFISGSPLGLSYNLVSGTNITGAGGSGVDSRVNLTGNPNLARGDRGGPGLIAFNTAVVQQPPAADFGIGNAPPDPVRGPGVNNFDLAILKNFPFGSDGKRRVQFRLEGFNAFNHTQFSGVGNAARFDASGKQVTSTFGTYTSAANARIVQLGLKFNF